MTLDQITPDQMARLKRAKDQAAEQLNAAGDPAGAWLDRMAVRLWSRAQQGDPDNAPPQLALSPPISLNPNSELILDLADSERAFLETDEARLAEMLRGFVEQARNDGRLPSA